MNFPRTYPNMARGALATLWRWRVLTALLIVVAVFGVEFYALNLPQANAAYTIANSTRLLFALLGYGTLIFLWRRQKRRKRNLRSSPVSSREKARISESIWRPRKIWRLWSAEWMRSSPSSFGVSMRSYKCNSTSTPVGSENWRPQSFRFANKLFAGSLAAPRPTRRGFSVFAFPQI